MNHSAFAESRDKLIALSERFIKMVPNRKSEIDSALENLKNNRFEIGVIGQIKAGKSTFLNALSQKPVFLPVSANPWTAVITRMYFGERHEPSGTAIFHFFTPDEWKQISERQNNANGNQIDRKELESKESGWRKMVDPVKNRFSTPDAEQKEFERREYERSKMVDRVNRQFGSELPKLLGDERRYDNATRDVLEQFLACGEPTDQSSRPNYSDVTREADIFFPLDPFTESCLIVDTPGTNDAVKARSDVTLRYLQHADAYLLLLLGPQALSAQDVNLINQLLLGLHKERIVVFINRIDNFSDIKKDTDKVKDRVEKWFKENYPKLIIPVLAGCAFWAEKTLKFDVKAARSFLYKDGVCDYGLAENFFTKEQFSDWENDPESNLDAIRQAMLQCSGFPVARHALADTLLREKGRALLEGARNNLLAKTEALIKEANDNADKNNKDAQLFEGDAKNIQEELSQLEYEIDKMAELKVHLAERQKTGEDELKMVLNEQISTLARHLTLSLQETANHEGHKLFGNGISIWDNSQWHADTNKIRSDLERVFLSQYPSAKDRIYREQQNLQRRLHHAFGEIKKTADIGTAEIEATLPAHIDPSPSLAALARECAVDLGGFWERLFSGTETAKDKAQKIKSAIDDDFRPVIDGLVKAAGKALEEAVDDTIKSYKSAVDRAVKKIEDSVKERSQAYSQRISEKDPDAIRKQVEIKRTQAAEQHTLATQLNAFAEEIRAFKIPGQPNESLSFEQGDPNFRETKATETTGQHEESMSPSQNLKHRSRQHDENKPFEFGVGVTWPSAFKT